MLLVGWAFATDTWTDVSTGVRLLARTDSKPWKIFAVEADLCTSGLRLRATRSAERKQTTSAFAEAVGAKVAINGDFFSYEDYDVSGLAIGESELWSEDNTSEGFITFGDDHAWISPPSENWSTPASWMEQAVAGRPQLVTEGVAGSGFTDPSHCSDRHPRSAVGLSRDRQTLWMVVVDGRSSASVGMTCEELADLMVDLGAWTALNLDGGGSSALSVDGSAVNDPSDGSERVVANHLGLVASGNEPAESCDWWQDELVLDAAALDGGPTDFDGDGASDLCARTATDFRCVVGDDTWTLAADLDHESRWSTIRTGDLDGDGLADVCARLAEGVRCWRSTGSGFDAAIVGPELSDAAGWGDVRYFSTLRMADVTGDGNSDLCARAGAGIWCWPSTGVGFGERIDGPAWSDADGWDDPEHYGSLRFGDIDGDGKADVCARADNGMTCHLGLTTPVVSPTWDDSSGWNEVGAWSTIRLEDVDGNGTADLCGRGSDGWRCHFWDGGAFGPAMTGPTLSDDSGWDDHANYATLRQADIDGDGDRDLCARANAGVYCWKYADGAWEERVDGPVMSDDVGWDHWRYYSTLRFGDRDADGDEDLCARSAAGMRCYAASPGGFGTSVEGPEWSDAQGWDDMEYYATIRLGGSVTRSPEDTGAAIDTSEPADSGTEPGRTRRISGEESACACGGGGGLATVFFVALGRRRGVLAT